MNDKVQEFLNKIPVELSELFFHSLNAKLHFLKNEHGEELKPLHETELIFSCVGSMLANYITSCVEPSMREYITAKLLYSLGGTLYAHVQTLEAINSPVESVDSKDNV